MYDSHIHTRHSPDAETTPAEIAQAAMAAGLRGVSLTDHADFGYIQTCDEFCACVR